MKSKEKVAKVYQVEGMTCNGCERTVSKVVGQLDGVDEAQASFKNGTVTVSYDPDKVTDDQIESAVAKVGYRFVGEASA